MSRGELEPPVTETLSTTKYVEVPVSGKEFLAGPRHSLLPGKLPRDTGGGHRQQGSARRHPQRSSVTVARPLSWSHATAGAPSTPEATTQPAKPIRV